MTLECLMGVIDGYRVNTESTHDVEVALDAYVTAMRRQALDEGRRAGIQEAAYVLTKLWKEGAR